MAAKKTRGRRVRTKWRNRRTKGGRKEERGGEGRREKERESAEVQGRREKNGRGREDGRKMEGDERRKYQLQVIGGGPRVCSEHFIKGIPFNLKPKSNKGLQMCGKGGRLKRGRERGNI